MTIAQALEQAGQTLQARYHAAIPAAELKRQAAILGGFQEHSIIPSDFCYNRTISGIPLPNRPMFIQQERGRYQFVGHDFRYTGLVIHKPRGGAESPVGHWQDGELKPHIDITPRAR